MVRAVLALLVMTLSTVVGAEPIDPARYERAKLFLTENQSKMFLDLDVQPLWINDGDRLTYKLTTEDGWRYMIADVAAKTSGPAFDHQAIAAALSAASKATLDAAHLPITALTRSPTGWRLTVAGKVWDCAATCAAMAVPVRKPGHVDAPGGRWSLFLKDNNLWVEDVGRGVERPLTTDGGPDRAWAAVAGAGAKLHRARLGVVPAPIGEFSPDGRYFLSFQLDERAAPTVTLIDNVPAGGGRPTSFTYRNSYVGDPPTGATLFVFDLLAGTRVRVDHAATPLGLVAPVAMAEVTWSRDSRAVYFTDYTNLFRTRSLFRADPATGQTTTLIDDAAKTNQYSFVAPRWRLLDDGTILWPSERSGWQQVYRYDAAGKLRNAVTAGDFVVRELLRVDGGNLVFSAGGREAGLDPYLRQIYRVALSGGAVRRLTQEDADHEVRVAGAVDGPLGRSVTPPAWSTDGRWFIDALSRIDLPTRTVIRRSSDGAVALTLATARHAGDVAPFLPPEPFEALAADGRTPIYGIIIKPSDFDPARRYPVIDVQYAGPQTPFVPKRFGWDGYTAYGRGLAELGFVVVVIDGRGLPLRSRANADEGYGHMGKAGFLEDHVAALQLLARTRPWLDLTRVGASGNSAGAFSVVHALFDYPDFYKVGVSVSPYDPAINDWVWAARFEGTTDRQVIVAEAASYANAARFRGKLLLMHGDLDEIADPSSTLRIADALIKADKDFDLLIVPGATHWLAGDFYAERRKWDYFVRYLAGLDPPSR